VDTAEAAVRGAGIVVTAPTPKTRCSRRIGSSGDAHQRYGSNQAKRRELPTELVRRADWIAVDSIEQARMESGDLLLALDENGWKDPKLVELKDVAAGGLKRRPSDITIFKSTAWRSKT